MDTIHTFGGYACTKLGGKKKTNSGLHILLHTQLFVCGCLRGNCSLPSQLTAWPHQLDTQRGYDLHCAAPFKNLSPYCRAWYKSEVVDWDIPSWLLAQGLGPVMKCCHNLLMHEEGSTSSPPPYQAMTILLRFSHCSTGTGGSWLYH